MEGLDLIPSSDSVPGLSLLHFSCSERKEPAQEVGGRREVGVVAGEPSGREGCVGEGGPGI